MAKHSPFCTCTRCMAKLYPTLYGKGGTMNSSAVPGPKKLKDGSGKRDHYFNGPGDGERHGHVVEKKRGEYLYVRDVEGNVYKDDRRKK